ncbi:hypothetical protein H7X65_01935 [Candidatus Parcubacteria bacterium]|nr:hypothetical protein [Candidatus Parcubacteria bacterium]
MISIYTRTNNIAKKEFWKYSIKKMLGKYSGPDAVLDSLVRGLTELGIPFEVNPGKPKYKTIHVLSGISILQEMIAKRSAGKIEVLIAGPTLVETPYDYDNIIQSNQIDLILFPSKWTKDFYVSLVASLDKKIKIWPAGVLIPEKASRKEKTLIFKKNIPEDTYNQIIKIIKDKDTPYDIITYGTYGRKEYQEKLESASVLIYLQTTESQGLALQEAWSYDVPTLVWKNTEWKTEKYSWYDEKISAPYLTDDSGSFFTTETLSRELDAIINNTSSFTPRKYCMENLSDKASAQKYLEIIKNHVK